MRIFYLSILLIGTVAVLTAVIKSKHIIKNVISSCFQGIMSLLAVNVIGLLTGVTIALNWYTIAFVSVFSTPACVALLLIDIILK